MVMIFLERFLNSCFLKYNVMINYFLGFAGGYEWIIVIVAILILFGGRKIPELMKGLGQGMREFKNARKEGEKDDDVKEKEDTKNK